MDTIKVKKGKVQIQLEGFHFEQDGEYYVYGPALDLIASGESREEASANFKEVTALYLEFAVAEGTLHKDLLKLGWEKHKRIKMKYNPPKYTPAHIMTLKGFPDFQAINQPLVISA